MFEAQGNNRNVLLKLSNQKNKQFDCLLSNEGRESLEKFIERNDYSRANILKQWLEIDNLEPPLELLWKLNEEEILFVTTYFYAHKEYTQYLYLSFHKVYSWKGNSRERQLACAVISNILVTVINTLLTFVDDLKEFIQEIVKNIIIQAVTLIDQEEMNGCYLTDLLTSVFMFQACAQEFAILNVKQLLSFDVDVTSLESAISAHSRYWTSKAMSVNLQTFLSKLVTLLPPEAVAPEIELAPEKPFCNWKYFFSLISFVVNASVEHATVIKGIVDKWLKTSLDERNATLLTITLMVARHCCMEKAKHFHNYVLWFGSLQLKNSTIFSFFFKFLTDLVPYESPLYLKMHISKVPSAPPGCQNIVSDYIALAKTRLSDLNESTEYLGLFNDFHESDKERQEADVAKVMSLYLETEELPKALQEAQVFRKQYYEKVFLKELLKVRENDDKCRAQIIHKLYSLGKIPLTLYDSWKSL